MEQKIRPLFAYNEPELYESGEVAQFIERPGLPAHTALRQIRRYAQEGFVYARAKRGAGPSAANLFAPSDAGAAAVLSALNGCGIQDREVMGFASAALYGWRREEVDRKAPHPITSAVYGIANGEHWRYDLSVLHDVTTGSRIIRAFCYDSDSPPRFDRKPVDNLVLIGSISIELSRLLLVVTSRIRSYNSGVKG